MTSEQKYHYDQRRLVGEAYWRWKDNHVDRQDWFVLQDLFRIRYAPCLERPQFSDLIFECKEILTGVGNILDNMAIEDPELEPKVDVEPEAGPEIIAELVSLQEEISSQPTEI